MNILQLSLLLAILLKCVISSVSGVAPDVIKALSDEEKWRGFKSIKKDYLTKWQYRNDLFDEVVMKSVEFIVGFINQAEWAKRYTLAALFLKRSDKVDEVLEKIKYEDTDLKDLTGYRPELAESHDKFFNLIDKINGLKNQELAVAKGIMSLFDVKKHASVIPLIDALGNRLFNGRKLMGCAIQEAFCDGALYGIEYFIGKFHEHPAVTSERYAQGLVISWKKENLAVFQFILAQADQDDLKQTKKDYGRVGDLKFRRAIKEAMEKAPPIGTRHARFSERTKRVEMENHRRANLSNPENINPYDGDQEAQVYLHLSCRYLAHEQARKYDSEGVQKRIKYDYYHSCLNTIWPGHTYHSHVLKEGEDICLKEWSFKKDQPLITRNNQPPFKAPHDGHCFSETGGLSFLFYAEDKPPMNLDVLKNLSWPKYKDVLAFRNSELKKNAMISRGKQQQMPNVSIILDSKKGEYLPFAKLKDRMQSFKLGKYDHGEIERLQNTLKRDAPNVVLGVIHKEATMTNVLPFHRPYTLIRPNSTIACIYNPNKLSPNEIASSSRYSTIIAEFTHHGSICCLVLAFYLKE